MKTLSNLYKKAITGMAMAAASLICATHAYAQVQINELQQKLQTVPQDVSNMVGPIINIVLIILGIAVIISLVIAYIQKRKDNNSNSNDKIIDALWTALVVILGIYAVKTFFFPNAQ